ncbi:hypothetical protein B0J13DRAFT_557647 [Dactylonectria estremocensis]|uniref:Uncharacterized protein n=1 Tax=Dactylonectria estremocensis TaxID=1079267 RepID=A0A9P9ENN0_9HYPO|nr:hypothetical protein B0J13DRAFT_557647 [Dactylonectria estremocensis]
MFTRFSTQHRVGLVILPSTTCEGQASMEVSIALRPKSGELRPQHNESNSTLTRDNVLEYDPDDYTLVNIRTETVQYGQYDGRPAALIILRFIVKFRPGNKRLRSFHVNIEFQRCGDMDDAGTEGSDRSGILKVAVLAPEERRGKIYTEERSITTSAGMDVPLGLSAPAGHFGGERASTVHKEHEMRLSGWKKSSASGVDNVVVWDCVEAKKAAKGVLPGYRGAIVVQYQEVTKFQAVITLDAQRGLWNAGSGLFEWLNLFGKKNADDPLLFDSGKPIGAQIDVADFKDLTLDDLVDLKPIETLPSGYN